MQTKTRVTIVIATAAGLLAAGCQSAQQDAVDNTNGMMKRYQANQPAPTGDVFSQYRQTAIEVENAQIHGVATTSFMFNQGDRKPHAQCPSIGFPMASTTQLTQGDIAEANGTYTGQSTGTYVVCVAPNGTGYVDYEEGFVHTVGGPAHWDDNLGIVLDGPPTVKVATKK